MVRIKGQITAGAGQQFAAISLGADICSVVPPWETSGNAEPSIGERSLHRSSSRRVTVRTPIVAASQAVGAVARRGSGRRGRGFTLPVHRTGGGEIWSAALRFLLRSGLSDLSWNEE